ncbi:MAG: hypothetical protein FXV80_01890 [Candidatus Thioglobus sp.]|nr:MAG: hypothetical protein FXV80_01890 [Candidatus Thioglobus sp.]
MKISSRKVACGVQFGGGKSVIAATTSDLGTTTPTFQYDENGNKLYVNGGTTQRLVGQDKNGDDSGTTAAERIKGKYKAGTIYVENPADRAEADGKDKNADSKDFNVDLALAQLKMRLG